jgi:hypothetical protein
MASQHPRRPDLRRDHFRHSNYRYSNFRRRANAVRSLPLELVFQEWGANRDRCDRHRWHTDRGAISITGPQFFNWHEKTGGGGAIDLVMHLGRMDVRAAVAWLEGRFQSHSESHSASTASPRTVPASGTTPSPTLRTLHLPEPDRSQLDRVRRYLTEQRGLSPDIIAPLIESGIIYADRRANAVFLMVAGKPHRPIGAELRGTGPRVWRGLAKGTRKDAGYFWVGDASSSEMILCESAIDAISCHQIHATQGVATICISTAGVRSQIPWLPPLIKRGYTIHCGFDNDDAGNQAGRQLIRNYPSLKHLIPSAHDWNDMLTGA